MSFLGFLVGTDTSLSGIIRGYLGKRENYSAFFGALEHIGAEKGSTLYSLAFTDSIQTLDFSKCARYADQHHLQEIQ
jgi:hypothetical protein